MDKEGFQRLVSRAEGETLDFKKCHYEGPGARNAFIKDVLSMANTPREQAAYIVLGVRWSPEEGSEVVGLERQMDDSELQDFLGRDRVQPYPRFTYNPFEFQSRKVGVLEIPVCSEGPYTPIKDYDGLQAGAIYYRRGTQNDRAVGSELQRIFRWFQNASIGTPTVQANDAWPRLFESLHCLKEGVTYLLGADRLPVTGVPVHALGMPPWRAVIDFDPDSDSSGLLHYISGTIGHHRVVHRVVRGEYRVQPEPGTHWFFARGLSGREDTLNSGDHRTWLKTYKRELSQQLERIAATVSPSPIVVLLIWCSSALKSHLRTLIEELYGAFGEAVDVVVAASDAPSFESLAEESGADFVPISLRGLCSGLAVHYADLKNVDDERFVLPSASGAPVEVDLSDWLWLSEDLEFVHRGSGFQGDDDPSAFRHGAEPSWRNLHLRHDCDREATPVIRSQLEKELQRRQVLRINLYHAPGAGGTTVGRRLAWDLHDKIPVGVLKRCEPRDTAERLSKVAALTESPVLLVVDGGNHAERDIDDLYGLLKASHTPVVLLQVLRRFHRQKTGKRQFWLDAELKDPEADRFREVYGRVMPEKRRELTILARRYGHRKAFFFGLTAFGKNFRGLRTHVRERLRQLVQEQRRLIVFIAIAHYYGQQSIPAQAFATLLGLRPSKAIDLPALFEGNASLALDLLIESQPREWRTAHHLIALEIMQQVLAPSGSQEPEAVWRQNLSSWGKEFANFVRGDQQIESTRLLELVRRVFVYRDNIEVLGTERAAQQKFAQLVEDVPSRHGRIDVLRHLTDCFPLEAHFHAHLGRFLSLNSEHVESVEHIDHAISLQPDDHVLHHMRGMALRQKMRAESEEKTKSADQIIEIAKDASDSFEEARRRAPDNEHGYISEVQLLIDLVDRTVGSRVEDLAKPDTDPFLRFALERAEDLLDQVQNLYADEAPSRYVLTCRARLQRIYGNYTTALQVWDNLLVRPDVARPPVRRQIVWTILRRIEGNWSQLKSKEIGRIQNLLEENLEEEVSDSTSLRLWLRVIRIASVPPSLDTIIEKVSYWKVNTGSLDAAYYLYVLHALRGLKGLVQEAADAVEALQECQSMARFRRDRTKSFEWIGYGEGIVSLVHKSALGDWKDDFWNETDSLARLQGRVASIGGPQKGFIELNGGMKAFFVPARAGLEFGRDENIPVSCYLGFSYEGPRAWGVLRI